MNNELGSNEDQYFETTIRLIETFQSLVSQKVPLDSNPNKYLPYLAHSAQRAYLDSIYSPSTNEEYIKKFGRLSEPQQFDLNEDEIMALDGFMHSTYAQEELLKLRNYGVGEILHRLVFNLFFSGICNGVVGGSDIIDQFKKEAKALRPDAELGKKMNEGRQSTKKQSALRQEINKIINDNLSKNSFLLTPQSVLEILWSRAGSGESCIWHAEDFDPECEVIHWKNHNGKPGKTSFARVRNIVSEIRTERKKP
jgi:hypothetical protein